MRLKQKAIHSGMLILDVDGGAQIDDVIAWLTENAIECVVSTTASHSISHHKFRVFIPLSRLISSTDYNIAWYGLNSLLGNIGNRATRNCTHLFYVPGQYPIPDNRFEHIAGEIAEPEFFINSAPEKAKAEHSTASMSKPPKKKKRTRKQRMTGELEWEDVNCVSLFENPIVPEHAIDRYLSRGDNWYHGRFGFMCSVVKKANREGYHITAGELISIFNDLNAIDCCHYSRSDDQAKLLHHAENVIKRV